MLNSWEQSVWSLIALVEIQTLLGLLGSNQALLGD